MLTLMLMLATPDYTVESVELQPQISPAVSAYS
jgi:hypothetical protein